MANYIILNGKNSNTITGLLIQNLPPISKPLQRTLIEEIDGRDGDIVTKLGYGAYDKEITIGLYGSYNVDDVISYFDSEGVVTFSNEPDKYYNYQIIEQIDFERLIRFKTATVRMHVQPFKYLLNEPEIEVDARSVTGEGQNIELKYTIENGSLSITPKGNTEQTTYTGINKVRVLDKEQTTINNITYSVTDGIISWSGTASRNTGMLIEFNDITLPAGTYYFYLLRTKTTRVDISLRTTNNVMIDVADFGNAFQNTLSNKSFTLSSDTVMHSMNLYFPNGTDTTDTYKIMICTASHTATEYEPYVGGIPSPNPDYPQPVKVVTGNNTINVCGKNLMDNKAISGVQNGVTYTINQDKSITLNGTSTKAFIFYIDNGRTLEAGTYTLSLKGKILGCGIYLYENNALKAYVSSNWENDKNTFTLDKKTTFSEIRIDIQVNKTFNNITIYPMIEKGSTATTYEPYQRQTYPINLGDIELCKIGDYQDYIYKENNKWYKHSEIGKIVYDGTESSWDWSKSINEGLTRYAGKQITDAINTTTRTEIYSNYYHYLSTGNEIGGGFIYAQQFFAYPNQDITTPTQFKKWLTTHNLIVYYILATPTNTEITDTELIEQLESINSASAYKEVTNISSTCASGNSLMYMSAVLVGMPNTTIKNNGNIFAKPILTIYGSGEISVYLDTIQVLQIDLGDYGSITIDVSQLEAYNESTGDLMNRNVIGDYSNLKIKCGDNDLTFSGNVMGFTMTKYNRWL